MARKRMWNPILALAAPLGAVITLVSSATVPLIVPLVMSSPALATGSDAAADSSGAGTGKDEAKPFAEVVEGLDVIEGLFTFYRDADENRVYMEIRPDQLGQVYLCSIMREAGDGYFFDSGAMNESFPFVLERVGKKIRFVHKNVYYRADPGTPLARAIDRGLTSSVLASTELAAEPHPGRGSLLVDAAALFVRDHAGVATALDDDRDYAFDEDGSYLGPVKSFPRNAEIEVVAHFTSDESRPTEMRIPDSRSMQHRYRYSLVAIPRSDYRPRIADDRVGYFVTPFQDFTVITRDTPYTWYVKRWNLQKADPDLALSPPKEPIVYWLANTIPLEHRDAVREGILKWNDAFERVGFKDAVVVKQQPEDADWDPADVRYNTVQWIVMPGGGYAVGPSHANPFTGEIYAADIRVSADFVRSFYRSYEEYVNPLSAFSDLTGAIDARPDPDAVCAYAQGKAWEAGFGTDLLMTQGIIDTESPAFKQYVHDGIVDLIAHEIGHTLGLRHNFRASTIHDLDEVHDVRLTEAEGVSGSVMDYNPVNVAGPDRKQGSFWCTSLGVYDYWAIAYGYTPIDADDSEGELPVLEAIASRCVEPKLTYGTDEDANGFSPRGVDPLINLWDLGPDPIAFYDQRLDLASHLLAGLESEFEAKGARYQKLRMVYGRAMRQYYYAALTASKFVGGMHHRRDHVDDDGGRHPFEPVPATKQREALDFLAARIFDSSSYEISPDVANKLAPERLADFDWSLSYTPRIDYPVHDGVLDIQEAALDRLYHPIALQRMLDLPLHADGDVLTMLEMFTRIRESIWSELAAGEAIDSFRRNLQRSHLDRLIALVTDPPGAPYYSPASGEKPAGEVRAPEDARTFARADLIALRDAMTPALARAGLDAATRAHLDESRARIEAALDARMSRKG